MLDIKDIIAKKEEYESSLKKKGVNTSSIADVISLYEKRNSLKVKLENLKSEQNKLSKQISVAADKQQLINQMTDLKNQIQEIGPEEQKLTEKLEELLKSLPNPPHSSVPEGGEDDAVLLHYYSSKPEFDFNPLAHWELGESLDLIDSKAGAKVAGSRFHFLKNELVLLQFALVQYAFSIIMKHNFTPLLPPNLVNRSAAFGTGFLESGHEDEVYLVNPGRDDLYLIGTSEVPNTAYLADTILKEEDLPLRFVSYSPCYRREAGSGGKDQRGILRTHQFDKIEMAVFSSPSKSWDEHELIRDIEEEIWQGLGIHYRLMNIAAKDLGGPAAKKYDIEAWMPGQNEYREVTSTSNCTDFQARRLGIRMKESASGKNVVLHTLNGTGIAIGRCLIAIMENYQTKEGEIIMPEVLHPWLSFKKISRED